MPERENLDNYLIGDYSGYDVYIEDTYLGKGGKLAIIEGGILFYVGHSPRLIPFDMLQSFKRLEDGFSITSIYCDGESRTMTVVKE